MGRISSRGYRESPIHRHNVAQDDRIVTPAGRRRQSATLTSAGTPWSAEEDARLCREFDAGMTTAQIALQHGRTSGAITSRLVKLGRIDPATVKSRDRGAQVASPPATCEEYGTKTAGRYGACVSYRATARNAPSVVPAPVLLRIVSSVQLTFVVSPAASPRMQAARWQPACRD